MEVRARIRFTTPCLGNVRSERRDKMLRNAEGKVLLLQSWWRAGLGYAAQALGHHEQEVKQIQAAPEVDGATTIYRRYYGASTFKEHEAFLAGAVIEVKFMLPASLSPESFRDLLETAGCYVGISPYGYRHDYGRFAVLDVCSARPCPGGAGEKHDQSAAALPAHPE